MVLYVLAAEKTSCHNKPFEAIQTSNDSNVTCHKETERFHGESVHKTILVQKLSRHAWLDLELNVKVGNPWKPTFGDTVFRPFDKSKLFQEIRFSSEARPVSCRRGIGSDCFPILTGDLFAIEFPPNCFRSNLVSCSFQI